LVLYSDLEEIGVMETATGEETFFEFLRRLYAEKHTGPVVIHMAEGQPKSAEILAEPVRIRLTEEESPRLMRAAVALTSDVQKAVRGRLDRIARTTHT
jgi:predicted CopG family antitoxin